MTSSLFSYSENAFNSKNLLELARHYNTPVWAYDAMVIKNRIAQLRVFDVIRFAQKSCSNIHILRLMRSEGVKVDSVSLGEIERALVAGYQPACNEIVFTADLFDRKVLERIIELKLSVNVGSVDMLHQLGSISFSHPIWLRVNPGFGYGYNKKTNTGGENSKHGIWYTDLCYALKVIKKYNLRFLGMHMHIGSGVDYSHLERVCDAMVEQIIKLDEDLEMISAGGGLSIPYREDEKSIDIERYFNLWNKARQKISRYFGHSITIEIEPGRFLVAESGVLVSQVRVVKNMGNRHFVLVDVGFNDLMRPSMYGSYHKISLLAGDERKLDEKHLVETIVAGPLCESGDVFTQKEGGIIETRFLPKAKVGDYLIFHDVGAYGSSMSSNYNTRPLIPEVLFSDGEARQIRRAQTIEELLSLEN